MVSSPHEVLHRIFQEDSGLFSRAAEHLLHVEFTEPYSVSVLSPDMTEIKPIERRADTVLLIESPSRTTALIVETQTKKAPERKRSWPYYIAHLHAKYECDVFLLVVTPKVATAKWARERIEIGIDGWHCMTVQPMVLGPDNVPEITSIEQASQDVMYALLSALTHAHSDRRGEILDALAAALNTVETNTATLIAELTEIGLGDSEARKLWRQLMATQTHLYQSEYAQILRAEGETQGEAKFLLRALERRGITVPEATREKITSCTDTDLLERWFDRALDATMVDDLFE